MLFQFADGQTVRFDQAFARDGVNYPADWLRACSPAERAAFGLAEIPAPAPFDDRYFLAPDRPRPLPDAKTARRAELAALRHTHETGGVAGLRTDRESQALLTGAALAATLDPAHTIDWKGADGWVTLDSAQLLAAARQVRAHVQACFSNERALAAAIDAAPDVASLLAIDLGRGWPNAA